MNLFLSFSNQRELYCHSWSDLVMSHDLKVEQFQAATRSDLVMAAVCLSSKNMLRLKNFHLKKQSRKEQKNKKTLAKIK